MIDILHRNIASLPASLLGPLGLQKSDQVLNGIGRSFLANVKQTLSDRGYHVVNEVLSDRPRFLVKDLSLVLGQSVKVKTLLLLIILLLALLIRLGLGLLLALNCLLFCWLFIFFRWFFLCWTSLEAERTVLHSNTLTL